MALDPELVTSVLHRLSLWSLSFQEGGWDGGEDRQDLEHHKYVTVTLCSFNSICLPFNDPVNGEWGLMGRHMQMIYIQRSNQDSERHG